MSESFLDDKALLEKRKAQRKEYVQLEAEALNTLRRIIHNIGECDRDIYSLEALINLTEKKNG